MNHSVTLSMKSLLAKAETKEAPNDCPSGRKTKHTQNILISVS